MDPWLLREIDVLEARIDEMGSPDELSREIRKIREEAVRIANASFMNGPLSPRILGADALKQQLERLRAKVNS